MLTDTRTVDDICLQRADACPWESCTSRSPSSACAVSLSLIAAPVLETIRAFGGFDPDSALGRGGLHIEPALAEFTGRFAAVFRRGRAAADAHVARQPRIARGHATLAKSMLVLP
jgi:hypothetical protein